MSPTIQMSSMRMSSWSLRSSKELRKIAVMVARKSKTLLMRSRETIVAISRRNNCKRITSTTVNHYLLAIISWVSFKVWGQLTWQDLGLWRQLMNISNLRSMTCAGAELSMQIWWRNLVNNNSLLLRMVEMKKVKMKKGDHPKVKCLQCLARAYSWIPSRPWNPSFRPRNANRKQMSLRPWNILKRSRPKQTQWKAPQSAFKRSNVWQKSRKCRQTLSWQTLWRCRRTRPWSVMQKCKFSQRASRLNVKPAISCTRPQVKTNRRAMKPALTIKGALASVASIQRQP